MREGVREGGREKLGLYRSTEDLKSLAFKLTTNVCCIFLSSLLFPLFFEAVGGAWD